MTENATVVAPVEIDGDATFRDDSSCTETGSGVGGGTENKTRKSGGDADTSTNRRDRQRCLVTVTSASGAAKLEMLGDLNAVREKEKERAEKTTISEEATFVSRAAERMLRGLAAVQAESERMWIWRETLGHPTTAGNVRLKVEVHVSFFRSCFGGWSTCLTLTTFRRASYCMV